MDWIEVQVVSKVDAGEVLGMLDDPAVTGAWEEDGLIHLYWPSDQWSPEALLDVKRAIACLGGEPEPALTVNRLPEEDWNAVWARLVRPLRIGRRVVIRPSWERVALGPDDIELVIDPKQAFGTGHHATTQLLIEFIEDLIRGGESVLDVGTGSGVLAMAALRLGAARALGIDVDPVAIECAREYAAVNGFGPELELRTVALTDLPDPLNLGDRRFHLIVANLDRQTIVESAQVLSRFLGQGATLLLSGVLTDQRQDIAEAFSVSGASLARHRERDGWLALDLRVPESCEHD